MGALISRLFRRHGHKPFVEGVVCKQDELGDNEMKICELPGEGRVLMVKQGEKISALGTKCSHYGAPLEKGVLSKGHIRCPWHGACFNAETGDIEDFPGLDGLPCYDVTVLENGDVKVRAQRDQLYNNKLTKPLPKRNPETRDVIVVLGGGGAGASCVESLRKAGFDGRVVLATKEKHLPYDRPKLSKQLDMDPERMQLRSAQFYESADIEVLLEHEAVSVDVDEKTVRFSNDVKLRYTSLVVATGSTPRQSDAPGADLDGVMVLRTPEDGNRLAAKLLGRDVVVVGASFIGMEVAAYCIGKASSITVVATSEVPYQAVLGARIGTMLRDVFIKKGVTFKMKCTVKKFIGENNKLKKMELTDGSVISADTCLLGIGVKPNTEFLRDVVKMDDRGYIQVNKSLETSELDVYAAGDVAGVPLPLLGGERVYAGHWQLANYFGALAGQSAAGLDVRVQTVPFFWTQMFGKSIRYAGHCTKMDEIFYSGSVEEQQFVAFFCQGGKVRGVATMNRDPEAARWAEHMAQHGFPSKREVQDAIKDE